MAQDSALSRALARQGALRHEIEERQDEIREIDTFLSLYRRFADDEPPNRAGTSESSQVPAEDNDQPVSSDARSRTKRSGLTQPMFEKIVRELLLARGRPAQRRALLDLFRESGNIIGGADEMRNLGTKLWYARAALTNIRGEGYWPTDVPCPDVGYIPPQNDSDETQHTFTGLDSAA